jgi:hypothetical protein
MVDVEAHHITMRVEIDVQARDDFAGFRAGIRRNAPEISMEELERLLLSTPQGPHKFATILSQEAKQLLAMDRYERRALSRRKFAIRALDEARRRSSIDCKNYVYNFSLLHFGRTKPN